MSQSIDVGTVLGGRYKVTSAIVTSHDGDLVLDGVDQILNRPVSILVSAPHNAEQLAQSAREVAVGERHVGIQVLDLGVSHGATYLITNHASAADLLDLIVAQEEPYVEPFFTDTLGSEIFGESRSREPETYDGLYDQGHHDYIQYPDANPDDLPISPMEPYPRANGLHGRNSQTAPPLVPPAAAPPPPAVPPQSAGPRDASGAGPAPSAPPKVTPWNEPTNDQASPSPAPTQATPAAPIPPEPPRYAPQSAPERPNAPAPSGAPEGRGTSFPAAARQSGWVNPSDRVLDRDDELEEDDESTRPKSVPWLVGGVLAVILIAALIFAFTTLGGVFQPQAGGTKSGEASGGTSQSASPGQSQPPAPVTPVIDSVTRLNPGELSFAAQFDAKLPLTFDGNPATYWSDMEFGSEDWGGIVKSVSLAVKLKDVSDIKQVELDQLGGTGGSVSVYTNAQPALTGATLAGTSSFNGQQLIIPLPTQVKAQYVIIQINSLPRLSTPKTQYPFGLRLAEIKVQ